MEIVKTENLSKSYGDFQALSEISLGIKQGSIYGILGPNGAGKTTLLRILTGILGPDKGVYLFQGNKFTSDCQQRIGYLPEERGLYKKMKVEEQLVYFARLKGVASSEAKARTTFFLEETGLDNWKNHSLDSLSKGMQQKVQFIASIIHNPDLIILDEPFSGFDPVNAELLKNYIFRFKKEGKTILLSTHRMENAEELCDKIVLINKGKNILEGEVKRIKEGVKKNRLVIEGEGTLPENKLLYEIVETESLTSNQIIATLAPAPGVALNKIIEVLMPHISFRNFKEELPSLHEIFIDKIKGDSNE
ncbi:MAG: ATP-binding cassette domain-containing protein [Sporocytophaga sp.]|uniref:ABC transporter ATP-binding protein n=1 Tax=Sporocytophaga sp. TaxID=2231183 RepID=UPI001B15C17C|nr:ATP-binding cassette domain-containing protein [Sporocytophaga sp.]MBO9701677.1 ATP-binding cassette domain-containing protein [Sporocytophaga sp.]